MLPASQRLLTCHLLKCNKGSSGLELETCAFKSRAGSAGADLNSLLVHRLVLMNFGFDTSCAIPASDPLPANLGLESNF